jgi:putative transposase
VGTIIKGKKREFVVDTMGSLHEMAVHSANTADCEGGRLALKPIAVRQAAGKYPRLAVVMGDHAYGKGGFPEWVEANISCTTDISTKDPNQHIFIPFPIRWVVEQTIACLGRNRRLSKDYEYVNGSSEAILYIASIGRSLKRLTCRD